MPDFDVQQVREAAARALFDAHYAGRDPGIRDFIWPQLSDGGRADYLDDADAAMAVIVPAVTAQIRALHQPVRVLERLPNGVATPWKACSCGFRTHSACPTVRLLDQIEASVRGEGQ